VIWILSLSFLFSPRLSIGQDSQLPCIRCDQDPVKGLIEGPEITKELEDISRGILTQSCEHDVTDDECTLIRWAKDGFKKYPHCSRFFVDQDGKLGELARLTAQRIVNDIEVNKGDSVFVQDYPDIDEICPNYKNFTPVEFVGFFTSAMEILAYRESSCDPNTHPNRASDVPNGPAVGLYQLELRKSLRSWRGGFCKVDAETILTPKGNTDCAMDIFIAMLKKNKKLFGKRNQKTHKMLNIDYWHSLNEPPRSKIVNANKESDYDRYRRYLARYPLCSLPSK